jgi:hypothetical protein
VGAHVDERQHKGGQGEGRQTKRRGIGKLPVLNGLVQTGLELSTKGSQSGIRARVNMGHGVGAGQAGAVDGAAIGLVGASGDDLLIRVVNFVGHGCRTDWVSSGAEGRVGRSGEVCGEAGSYSVGGAY